MNYNQIARRLTVASPIRSVKKEVPKMGYTELYKEKKLSSALDAVRLIRENEDIIIPVANGMPRALYKALETHDGLKNCRLFQLLIIDEIIDVDPRRLKIISLFLSGFERKAFNEGKIDLLPNHFSDVPRLLKEITNRPVIMATVAPMEEEGYFSFGTNSDYTVPLLPHAGKIILEVNENMPRTYGGNKVHIRDVTAFIENNPPLFEAPTIELNEKDEKIGQYVAELIKNGDTLQIGFGGIPNAIMKYLLNYRNLTIHTEMFPDLLVDLYESGAVTNEKNVLAKGKMTATFAYGTRRLYDFIHENELVRLFPVNMTNDPRVISQYDNMISINSTVEVDFFGQCNSETIGGYYYSSTGGQGDFSVGARLSKSGKGIICLHSTAKNDTISKIVPALTAQHIVTTSKNDVDYVVTEYGIAKLRGKTVRERTKELIQIAHPKFREQLTYSAKKLGYLL